MKDIESIVYQNNNSKLIINIGNKNQIIYQNVSYIISNEKLLTYLSGLYTIINDWQKEYIDLKAFGNNYWSLSINYVNGNKEEYNGKSSYPNNFEALEELNQDLICEARND